MPKADEIQLERTPLFEQVASRLEELILSGELRIGDKLPGVDALASKYSVSRGVVREALIRLRSDGLTETINGSGTFVKPIDTNHLASALTRQFHLLNPDAQAIRNLFEARIGVERMTARLAAKHATAPDVKQLRESLKSMQAASGTDDWITADVGFHLTIAAVARNPFLQMLITPLTQVIGRSILARLEGENHTEARRAGIESHRDVIDAIAKHNGARAEKIMCEHLLHAQDRLINTLEGRALPPD